MRKTILLGMPEVSELYKLIEDNLKFKGFHVINIVEDSLSFRYPSFRSHLYVKYRKLIHKDTYAKKQLQWQILQKNIARKIEQAGGLDYALFISGDIYSKAFLEFIRSQSRNGIVNYQFDGLHRFPAIYPLIDTFDRFYVFDPNDLAEKEYHFLPATNFYFDHKLSEPQPQPENDFYFIGVHIPSRQAFINHFAQMAKQHNWKIDFNIAWKKSPKKGRQLYPQHNINLIKQPLSFAANQQRALQSKILVDFVVNEHKGLSFRVFEALGFNKKLITTNTDIAHYDFYHPDNILILNNHNWHEIHHFLNAPMHPIPEEIRTKYSFSNWINYILDIEPHSKISLPI